MLGVGVEVLYNVISTRSFTLAELNGSCHVWKDVFVPYDIDP